MRGAQATARALRASAAQGLLQAPIPAAELLLRSTELAYTNLRRLSAEIIFCGGLSRKMATRSPPRCSAAGPPVIEEPPAGRCARRSMPLATRCRSRVRTAQEEAPAHGAARREVDAHVARREGGRGGGLAPHCAPRWSAPAGRAPWLGTAPGRTTTWNLLGSFLTGVTAVFLLLARNSSQSNTATFLKSNWLTVNSLSDRESNRFRFQRIQIFVYARSVERTASRHPLA